MSAQSMPVAEPIRPATSDDLASRAARVPAHIAATEARWLKHFHPCDYWLRMDPAACTCEARPVVELLLAIARRATG